MTWLDRAISWVSPKAGLTRVRARAALEMMRAYEGASLGRRTSSWRTTGASANTEIAGSLPRLRARSRDLVRNNPYARRAITTLVGNSIGVGIRLGIKNAQAGKVWSQWLVEADFHGDHDLYGLQALGCRAAFESGDCLIIRVRTTAANAGRSGVPLRLKVLEGDFLDTTKTGPQQNGNYVIAGIEVDPQGRRVAYYLFNVHPGDTVNFQLKIPSTRVLAEDVIYHYEKERPGQILGVPRLAASIMRLRDVDEYQEALLVKKKIEACFAAFVTSSGDDRPLSSSVTTDTTSDGASRRVEKLSPGTIIYGKEGEEVTFGNPSSGPEVGFIADELRAIAMGIGCTYEQLTGDLSNTNYSSMRGGRSEFKILIEQYRWLSFVPQVCERIYGWFEEAAFLAGRIRTTELEHIWTPPRWEYVNPKEDVETDMLELKSLLASHSAKLRERGEDRDQVLKEVAEDAAEFAKIGVEPDYSIGKSAAAPAPVDATATDAQQGGRSITLHNTVNVPERETRIENTVNIPERETKIENTVNVPERETRIENTVNIPERETKVENTVNMPPLPSRTVETIHRDENHEITRITREAKE